MNSQTIQNQENQTLQTIFFESNQSPIISLLNKVFLENSDISIQSVSNKYSDNALESVNAEFVYTKKPFVIEIIHQSDFLVNIVLKNNDTLTEEETTIFKKLMKQLNEFGFCFYVNNEQETIDFDSLFYPKAQKETEKTIKVKTKITSTNISNNDVWTQINKKMKELNLPFKIVNRIRVQKNNFQKKYGENYTTYIDAYAKQQFEEFLKD